MDADLMRTLSLAGLLLAQVPSVAAPPVSATTPTTMPAVQGTPAATATKPMPAPSLADPFQAPGATALTPSTVMPNTTTTPARVEAVRLRGRFPLAIIGGTVYRVGDVLGDGRVAAIHARGVTVQKGAEREELLLYPDVRLQHKAVYRQDKKVR